MGTHGDLLNHVREFAVYMENIHGYTAVMSWAYKYFVILQRDETIATIQSYW